MALIDIRLGHAPNIDRLEVNLLLAYFELRRISGGIITLFDLIKLPYP